MSQLSRFVTRHWTGQLPVGVSIALAVIASTLMILRAPDGIERHWQAMHLLILPAVIWITVGLMRGGEHAPSGPLPRWLCYPSAVVVVVVAGNLAIHAAIGPPPPPDIPALPAPAPYPVTGGTIEMQGPIDYRALARLKATLAADPDASRLALTSDGGLIYAARAMAVAVEAAGLDTLAETRCASACTLVFMAGTHRAAKTVALGFHGYADLGPFGIYDIEEEEALDRTYFIRRGMAPDFAARALATPHTEMWFPDNDLLRDGGVITDLD